ncbi:filamin-A-like isoform X3 [Haliotis asinina]|uniref:filamin-A-like isoform X3 n=1 Tax=Haliotis asinina TaxID=109174 RepID=UPI003531D9C8
MPEQTQGPVVQDNNDGTICVQYKPQAEGKHEVQMTCNGDTVKGSPFSCIVDSVGGGFVTAFGVGLVGGNCGQNEEFTVVAAKGTAKDIDIKIDGPSKVDMKRKDNPDGSANVSYMPMTPGAYSIAIKYKSKHIKGSPFNAKVSGEGRKRSQLSLGNSSVYSLKVIEPDIVNLNGTIKSPSGNVEPCILKRLGDGELGVASFNPREKGAYTVYVCSNEKNIKGSPFTINIGDKELAHAGKVKVSGATGDAIANSENELIVDTTDSGYGGLSVNLEGPHRSDVNLIEKRTDRQYVIHYSPHEPGIYILNIRFADDHVTGSPFLLNVGGNPSGRVRETVTKQMEAASASEPGNMCTFILQIPGTNPFDMEASVTDPDGTTELCDVMDLEDFHYKIQFTPKIKGAHILSVKHKSMHISGSPFTYSVGQLNVGGYHKVQVGGPGLERGEVGLPNAFNIYTREAGPGSLSVSIEGNSRADIKLEPRENGFLGCCYTVAKPGMYGVHIKYDDKHIPNSPFMVNISPDSGATRQVTVHSLKDRGLQVDRASTFTVNFNGAKGALHAMIRTPSGGHDDCFIQEMDTGLYAVRFIPRENGVHYVDVKLNDAHIPDSPFAVMVGSTAADPAMVTGSGDGLEVCKCGQKAKFVVKTAGAGSGLLAVVIDGPSKVSMSCHEVDEGYEFVYTPFSAGDYLITVKYGNIPVAGSPWKAVATDTKKGVVNGSFSKGTGRKAAPGNEQSTMVVETVEKKPGAKTTKKFRGDASKVTCKGNGLKKCFTNRVLNITVDVRDAGQAMLSVGMIGPNGLCEPELSVKKMTNTTYQVSYKVVEIGEHVLQIKWGDDDIPGSPFHLST